MEPGGGQRHTGSSPVQYVRGGSEPESRYGSTSASSTNQDDSSADEAIDMHPQDRQQSQLNRTDIQNNYNVVFNYSTLVITDPMNRLFNRGLNFSILPLKLDITQTLVEFKRYERSAIWTEFWYGKDNEQIEEPIF